MNQQAGASCPSRTPSISLAPPRASALPHPSFYHPLLRLRLTVYPPPPPLPCPRDHLPRSSLFRSSLRHPLRALLARADTSRQPTTTYYSKVISLSRHRSFPPSPRLSISPTCLPVSSSRPRAAPRPVVIRGDEPAGRFYGRDTVYTSVPPTRS